MSNEAAAVIPEGQSVNDYVGELIQGQYDEQPNNTDKVTDRILGKETPVDAVRGEDSGSGAVDLQDTDAPAGVEDDPQEGQESAIDGESDPVTLNKLAEHLELESKELYEVEVPIGEGVTATLGQLKDEYKQYGPAKEYQERLTENRQDFEKQVLQTRSELNSIMQAIPAEMRHQIIQQAKGHQASWKQEQETAVLEAIPEWADTDQRAKSRADLISDGAEYGFSEAEITATQDARTLRFMRDFSVMKRELQGMKAAAKAKPGQANAPARTRGPNSKTRLSQLLQQGRSAKTTQDKVAVAAQLIRQQDGY